MKCKFIKDNETLCNASSMENSSYCYLHNPDIPEEDKLNAQSRGGKANKIKIIEPLSSIKLTTSNEVVLLLEDTINRVRSGEMDLKVANCIGYLSGHLIKAFEVTQLHQRIELIEKVVLSR